MKQQILDILNTIPEEEQNILMEELTKSLKQQRLAKTYELEEEARRINWSIKTL